MRISACVITKNEEKNLPRWLNCMKRIADEVIVVDTGSEDETVHIARASGAKVFFFQWMDDFSAAKNFAIEKATGDWILFLDADEYFLDEDCSRVRAVFENYYEVFEVAGLIFHMVNIDMETGKILGGDGGSLRGFRNCHWLRYEGNVHERLEDVSEEKIGKGKVMQYIQDITVYHTGYTQSGMEAKMRRNLALLEKLQAEGKGRDMDAVYLTDCYYGLGEYEKAIASAREAIRLGVEPIGLTNRPYTILIQSMLLTGRPEEEIREALEAAVKKYPQAAEYQMFWGMFDWDRRDYEGAQRHFLKGLDLRHAASLGTAKDAMVQDNSADLLPTAYYCLGELAGKRGRQQEAAGYLLESLKLKCRSTHALRAYCRLFGDASAGELARVLRNLYETGDDREFLVQNLQELGMEKTLVALGNAGNKDCTKNES